MKKRYYDDHDYYKQENEPGVAYINNFRPDRHKNSLYSEDSNNDIDGYYDHDYPDNYSESSKKKNNRTNSQLLITLQIISCAIIVLGVLLTKSISPQYYEYFKSWYLTQLNKSIIVGENLSDNTRLITAQESNVESSVKQMLLSRPIKNAAVITSNFDELRDNGTKHKGLDIATDHGSSIYCPLRGSVELADENDSYGKYVIINHGNGIKTLYAHCDSIAVKIGTNVSINDVIAYVGSTGDSTGPHLHFELIINNEYHDPLNFMKEAYV